MRGLFLLILSTCYLSVFSQWGIKGGTGITSLSSMSVSKYKAMGHVGATYDFKLSEKWYIQPELTFSTNGTDLKSDGLYLKKGHINTYALELPVALSFRPNISNDINLIFDCGWFIRYAMFGNKKYVYYEHETVSGNPFDAYKRFDTGFTIGAGLAIRQYYGIVSFLGGVTSIDKQNNDVYNRAFRLGLGYRFKK